MSQDVHGFTLTSERIVRVVSTVVPRHSAARTPILLAACYETLFGMIGDIRSEDGEDAANAAVGTGHWDAVFARINKRVQDLGHTAMEESVECF